MASRSLTDLHPFVRWRVEKWLRRCRKRGVEVLVYCTFRSASEQDRMYAQGRDKPGRIITNAKGGESWHQYCMALDAVPMIDGKTADWTPFPDLHEQKAFREDGDRNHLDPRWRIMVEEATSCGLEWGGDWSPWKDYLHFQYTLGLSLKDAKRLFGGS